MEPAQSRCPEEEEIHMVANGELQRSGVLTLCLPFLDEKDPFLSEKKSDAVFIVLLSSPREQLLQLLDQIIQAARILHLNDVEIYFIEDDDVGPFSTVNELKSLHSILEIFNCVDLGVNYNEIEAFNELLNATIARINSVAHQSTNKIITEEIDTTAEELLLKWGQSQGARSKVKIAHFEGAGRGAVALEDINIGEVALEIPESIIISEDLLYKSDMFKVLEEWKGMTIDSMLLLWCMKERYNLNSNFKDYFRTLPSVFKTGLSFGVDALTVLHGTLVLEELLLAKEHLRQQYESLCPALCASYPDIFQPELYTWDHYLWACELWYSNGMKVIFSDGKLRTCLVPIAGLLNHSLWPHIINYGRVDSETKSLKFQVARQCKRGEQCYLSYGSLPGSHLVTFYGFLPNGDNPYDIIPLDFETPEANNSQSLTIETSKMNHMVRGTWFSRSSKPYSYGLPPLLLNHLRSVLASGNMGYLSLHPQEDVSVENERALFETLMSIFEPMMEVLQDSDDLNCEDLSWDVKLALDYKDLQRRIISSVLSSCATGLETLSCA
ncbi:hypothetical protein HPP92_014839 [Vanilla planifolia]|uniref:SET domain-containing protein n=1 Tax=Vanilla planifolia TaxID=51239 RepID=A0A835QP31_VANPL|nr:hypothetical protein HPP92_014839 [Vanilla planifolia]